MGASTRVVVERNESHGRFVAPEGLHCTSDGSQDALHAPNASRRLTGVSRLPGGFRDGPGRYARRRSSPGQSARKKESQSGQRAQPIASHLYPTHLEVHARVVTLRVRSVFDVHGTGLEGRRRPRRLIIPAGTPASARPATHRIPARAREDRTLLPGHSGPSRVLSLGAGKKKA